MSCQCTGCGLHRLDAINAVLNGKVACCPDCSTLTVEERNLIRSVSLQGEALRRLRKWGGLLGKSGYSADVVLSVVDWIDGGMIGHLPPLPNYLICHDLPWQYPMDSAQLRAAATAVPVNERPWEQQGWCDDDGFCWLCNHYSTGRWNYDTPHKAGEDYGPLGNYTHSLPHWFIPRPRPTGRTREGAG